VDEGRLIGTAGASEAYRETLIRTVGVSETHRSEVNFPIRQYSVRDRDR
jgi:hypothetical protein